MNRTRKRKETVTATGRKIRRRSEAAYIINSRVYKVSMVKDSRLIIPINDAATEECFQCGFAVSLFLPVGSLLVSEWTNVLRNETVYT